MTFALYIKMGMISVITRQCSFKVQHKEFKMFRKNITQIFWKTVFTFITKGQLTFLLLTSVSLDNFKSIIMYH